MNDFPPDHRPPTPAELAAAAELTEQVTPHATELEQAQARMRRSFEILTIHLANGPGGTATELWLQLREIGFDVDDPEDRALSTMVRLASVLLHLVCAHGRDDHRCGLTPSALLAHYATTTARLRG